MPDNIHESAWNRTASGWSTNGSKEAPKENSYADLVAYDVDNTRLVNKYKTIANTAGHIPMPPRPKKSANSPRSAFLDDLRVCNAPPLDFSFLQLNNLADLHMAMEEFVENQAANQGGDGSSQFVPRPPGSSPRAGRPGTGGGLNDMSSMGQGGDDVPPGPAPVRIRKRITAVRLNNNQFKEIKGVAGCLAAGIGWKPESTTGKTKSATTDSAGSSNKYSRSSSNYGNTNAPEEEETPTNNTSTAGGVEPNAVRWLDVSHNQLGVIDGQEISAFQELRVLNMQSNNIERLKEVAKLKGLQHLRTLTLFANPVEQKKNYRWYVIATLPQLTKLDATVITEKERHRARYWWKCRIEAKKRAALAAESGK